MSDSQNASLRDHDPLLNYTADITTNKVDHNHNSETSNAPPKLSAMSPLAASATVVNLILATGPFSYCFNS